MLYRLLPCLVALGLAACGTSGSGPRVTEVETAPPPSVEEPDNNSDLEPDPEIETEPVVKKAAPPAPAPAKVVTPASGSFAAKDIMRALSNQSFAYDRGSSKGTISYSADGTFSYNEKGRGEGTGVWQASEGKLCEAFDPTGFLPKGRRSECFGFKAMGGSYVTGKTRLSPV